MNDRPNVLLIMTDQQKASSLPAYGNPLVRTPAITSLAEGGVVVDGAICNYPACTPARATVHTGRYAHVTGVRANHIHLPEREITLPLMLRRHGYETALIGKNHVFADGSPGSQFRDGALALRDWPDRFGKPPEMREQVAREVELSDQRHLFDHWFEANHFGAQGAEHDEHRRFSLQPFLWRSHAGSAVTPFPASEHTSGVLGSRATEFVTQRADADRPWFLWLSFPDPHNPYHAPEPFASMYDPDEVDLPAHDPLEGKPERQRIASAMCGMRNPREEDIRRAVAIQYAQVSAIDAAIGQVLDALERSGATSRTLVLFMTDHGGYVGDHGAWHKAPAFYECLIRIPLIVSWPGTIAAGRLTDGFLEQIDLMPTILDLAGAGIPPGVQGRSVAASLGGTGTLREVAFAEAGEVGDPVGWDDLPFMPDDPLDDRYFGWDGFQEAWIGQGKMIRTADRKYVWYANGDEELYDLTADPEELVNLAGRPESADTVRELRDRLLRWCVESEDQLPVHARNVYFEDVVAGTLPF